MTKQGEQYVEASSASRLVGKAFSNQEELVDAQVGPIVALSVFMLSSLWARCSDRNNRTCLALPLHVRSVRLLLPAGYCVCTVSDEDRSPPHYLAVTPADRQASVWSAGPPFAYVLTETVASNCYRRTASLTR